MNQIHPGFEVVDLTPGEGITAEVGSIVMIEWRGWRNREDECSRGRTTFRVGHRQLIAEVEQAVIGMQVGGVRRLWFRPRLEVLNSTVVKGASGDLIHFELQLLAITSETETDRLAPDVHHDDPGSSLPEDADSIDRDDEQLRAQIIRQRPSAARLDALIAQRRPSPINYDLEDDELPC